MNDSLYHAALLALAKSRRDDPPPQESESKIVRIFRDNPLCGDSVALSAAAGAAQILKMPQIAQRARGCILCEAATALMANLAEGADAAALRALCAEAEDMFANGGKIAPQFSLFAPVAAHPARHECVLLPFRALADLLAALQISAPRK